MEHRKSLQEIGTKFLCDKFTRHSFAPIYENYFADVRTDKIKILEIGIGGENAELGGSSLLTWEEYFPNASIIGIDIYDKSSLDSERITTRICDQSDVAALNRLGAEFESFDVIIDDGSHFGHDTNISLFTLFPYLAEGGLFIIEDIQTSYWPTHNGSSLVPMAKDTSVRWLKLLIDKINAGEILESSYFPLNAGIDASELHVYHNIAVIKKRRNTESVDSAVLGDDLRQKMLKIDADLNGKAFSAHQTLLSDPNVFFRLLNTISDAGGVDKSIKVLERSARRKQPPG